VTSANELGKVPVGHEIGSEIVVGVGQADKDKKNDRMTGKFPIPGFPFPEPEPVVFEQAQHVEKAEEKDQRFETFNRKHQPQENRPRIVSEHFSYLVFGSPGSE